MLYPGNILSVVKDIDTHHNPSEELLNGCALRRFMQELTASGERGFDDFEQLHNWSVREPAKFWCLLISISDDF